MLRHDACMLLLMRISQLYRSPLRHEEVPRGWMVHLLLSALSVPVRVFHNEMHAGMYDGTNIRKDCVHAFFKRKQKCQLHDHPVINQLQPGKSDKQCHNYRVCQY